MQTLRILILGGTGFIGPYQVRTAVERGHAVTVFSRGTHPADLPPGIEHLHGDREHRLDVLRGRNWDVVIDNPVMLPAWVRSIGALLEDRVGHYIFISTVSVYSDLSRGMDETSSTVVYAGRDPFAETTETFRANMATLYGPLKVVAEQEAERSVSQSDDHRAAGLDRRSCRSNRSFHLLACARGARWRGAGAGNSARSGAGD